MTSLPKRDPLRWFVPFVTTSRVWTSAVCMMVLVLFQCSFRWHDLRPVVSLEGQFSGKQAMTEAQAAAHIKVVQSSWDSARQFTDASVHSSNMLHLF